MTLEAPYAWTIAEEDRIVPGPDQWPEVEYNYIFITRASAEAWAKNLRDRWGRTDARAVPVPRTGAG